MRQWTAKILLVVILEAGQHPFLAACGVGIKFPRPLSRPLLYMVPNFILLSLLVSGHAMSNDSTVSKPQRAADVQNAGAHFRSPGADGRVPTHGIPRIMPNGKVSSSPPGAMTPKVATQLARKRARDRRAQQAMRDRTRGELEALKGQVTYLTQVLSEQEKPTGLSANMSINHVAEIRNLQEENERLKQELIRARQVSQTDKLSIPFSVDFCNYAGLIIEPSILELWSSHLSRTSSSPPARIPEKRSKFRSRSNTFVLSDLHDIPWHVAPTCPADRIMQPFCEEKRRLVRSSSTSSLSPGPSNIIGHADIQAAISKVAADVLATYSEIDTLPKKVACLYMISSVLNVITPLSMVCYPPISNACG